MPVGHLSSIPRGASSLPCLRGERDLEGETKRISTILIQQKTSVKKPEFICSSQTESLTFLT
jgi:hypothetical protein